MWQLCLPRPVLPHSQGSSLSLFLSLPLFYVLLNLSHPRREVHTAQILPNNPFPLTPDNAKWVYTSTWIDEWISTCNIEIMRDKEKWGRRGFSPGLEPTIVPGSTRWLMAPRQQLTTRPGFSKLRPFSLRSAYRKGIFAISSHLYIYFSYHSLFFLIYVCKWNVEVKNNKANEGSKSDYSSCIE